MIGNIFLTFAFLAAVFSFVMYYLSLKGYTNTLKYARLGYHATAVSVIVSSALLFHAILTHQYQYGYVFNYSGSNLSIGMLLSTFWAGQEGSFLLWTFFTAIIGLILLDYTSKRGDLELRVMMVFTLSLGFLLLMVSPLLKSPFNYIWNEASFLDVKYLNQSVLSMPFIQNFIMSDQSTNQFFVNMNRELHAALSTNSIAISDFIIQGKGLNPLLQNFWMQIHPPLLFVGFAMSVVPFSFAIAAIIKNEYKEWVKQSLPWLLSASAVLGLAIMLGGYWAYGVLGWGGYWGWDPVENSSLVPWLVSVAAIHTMLVQKKTEESGGGNRFVKTNLILSILTYLLVLYSTFLTRSGILGDSSVHSFGEPGMMVYWFLILFLLVFTVMGAAGIIYRWKYLMKHFSFEENILSRELALFAGSMVIIASAVIILFGTSTPVIDTLITPVRFLLKYFGIHFSMPQATPEFYDLANLPIAIFIGLLNGISLLVKWKQTDTKEFIKHLQYSVIAAIVLTALTAVLSSMASIKLVVLTFSAYFAIVVNAELLFRVFKGRKLFLGGHIAHIGFAIFILGVVATAGFSQTEKVDLIKGNIKEVLGYKMKFTGYAPFDNGKKFAFNIELQKGESKNIITPVMYNSESNNSLMREPDILEGFFKDLHVAPLSYSDGAESNSSASNKVTLEEGNSYDFNNAKITFAGFNFSTEARSAMMAGTDFQIGAKLKINYSGKETEYEAVMKTISGNRQSVPVEIKEADIRITMDNMDAAGKVILNISNLSKKDNPITIEPEEILSVEVSVKPFISLVWIGVLVTIFGFVISVTRRSKELNS